MSGGMGAEFCAAYDSRRGYITNNQIGIPADDQSNESSFSRLSMDSSSQDEVTLEILQTRNRDGAEAWSH